MIDEFCAGAALIPYSKVTLVQYQTLSKDSTTWKVDVNKLSDVNILQGLWLLFIDKSDHFANKNEEFYNPTVKKVLTVINGMPLQLFASGIKARNIYPELKKMYFYIDHLNVKWEEVLTTTFGLWVVTQSSTNNNLHSSGEKSDIFPQIEKNGRQQIVLWRAMCSVL